MQVILTTVFKNRVATFVAVFVVIVAILFGNRAHFNFSCHGVIIPHFLKIWYN
jgi:hypothetical protein